MPRRHPDDPFFDPRPLPSVFPRSHLLLQLPRDIRSHIEERAAADGDDPADVLRDVLVLAIDELHGATFDPRELGYGDEPAQPAAGAL